MKKRYRKKIKIFTNTKAFTLIELLVVISIIGVLIALSLFGIQGARESSRDAKRKADLETIRSALEMYRSDEGIYPNDLSLLTSGDDPYLTVVPEDMVAGRNYGYVQAISTYKLCAALEGLADEETIGDVTDCNCEATCNYAVTNP